VKVTIIGASLVTGIGFAGSVIAAPVFTETDRVFDDANWTFVNDGGTNVGSITRSQAVGIGLSGGPINLNAQVTHVNPANASQPFVFQTENYKTDQSWQPSGNDLSDTLLAEFAGRTQIISSTIDFEVIAHQGSGFYVATPSHSLFDWVGAGGWGFSGGASKITDFTLMRGTGPATLDLSASASPIQFGYTFFNAPYTTSANGIDYSIAQFKVTINPPPVPEPATIGIFCLGSLPLIVRRRRSTK
jgi:hypothetical protein